MAIDFQRAEYKANIDDWHLIDAVCDERDLDTLLPTINPLDKSEDNRVRNEFYKERASWFGASQFTLQGMIGTAFETAPKIELPAALEYLRTNADGSGLDAQQQLQATTDEIMRKGRCGLFVTYPEGEGEASVADQAAGFKVSTIHVIDAKRIINWWTIPRGAQVILGGVVFTDSMEIVEDYEIKSIPILRELALEEGTFVDRKWIKPEGKEKWEVLSEAFPKDGGGTAWSEIPFQFVGATDNTTTPDRPPMLSLARKNRDHYRNSADFEESTFFAGSPQPWAKGITQDDVNDAKKEGFYIGSRRLIACESFAFAQADANPMSRQAMLDKVEEMKAIGARFLMPGGVAKTAQQDASEQKGQHSVLSLVVANVEDAYNHALLWVSQYMRTPEAFVTMSRDFMHPEVAVEKIRAFVELWDRGLVGATEAHGVLMKARILDDDKTVDEYSEEVEARGGMIGGLDADAGPVN